MTQLTTHHPRSGWKEEESRLLFDAVRAAAEDGRSLREVFQEVGGQLQRKPNSIRNYYYARIRETPELSTRPAPFRAFTPKELHTLLREVLMGRGQGERRPRLRYPSFRRRPFPDAADAEQVPFHPEKPTGASDGNGGRAAAGRAALPGKGGGFPPLWSARTGNRRAGRFEPPSGEPGGKAHAGRVEPAVGAAGSRRPGGRSFPGGSPTSCQMAGGRQEADPG